MKTEIASPTEKVDEPHEPLSAEKENKDIIVVYGDPVLEKKTIPVTEFDDNLKDLVSRMHRAMIDAPGVGLAAPQIGVGQRIAIVDLSGGKDPQQLIVMANPEIVETSGVQKGEEGCLSFPEITTVIERPFKVKIRAQNISGETFELEGEELLARAFCHEIDHLDGVLILDRVSRLKQDIIRRRIQRRVKAGTWHNQA